MKGGLDLVGLDAAWQEGLKGRRSETRGPPGHMELRLLERGHMDCGAIRIEFPIRKSAVAWIHAVEQVVAGRKRTQQKGEKAITSAAGDEPKRDC